MSKETFSLSGIISKFRLLSAGKCAVKDVDGIGWKRITKLLATFTKLGPKVLVAPREMMAGSDGGLFQVLVGVSF
jgi:hypothetical protein